jgi:glycosyltransferase involved in cell wall biosynthesis
MEPYTIALLGSFPPPYGGVTVHIQRLYEAITKKGFRCHVYDFDISKVSCSEKDIIVVKNPVFWAFKYLFSKKEDIVHTHNSDWRIRAMMGILSLTGTKTMVSIHGESLKNSICGKNFVIRFLVVFSLKRVNYIIAANKEIFDLCISVGIKKEKIAVIVPFIPPQISEDELEITSKTVQSFIDNHSPVITAYAFKIAFYNNQDLYGIDLCIDLCSKLKQVHPTIGFIFYLPDIGDSDYYDKLNQKIAEYKIGNNFLFVTEKNQFLPILVKSTLFVRPTNTDGDSLSIRESLFFGIPVITSDVIQRPDDVILFKNRDLRDLTDKTLTLLKNYDAYKKQITMIQPQNSAERIIEIYGILINKK